MAQQTPEGKFKSVCVIIIDPAGKELDFAILERACERNRDGWGLVSMEADKSLHISKGMTYQGAKKAWKKYAGLKRVFHARIGTSGEKDLANCHPFDATYEPGKPRLFLHNGTIDIPRMRKDMCDSWHFAKYIQAFPDGKDLNDAISAYATRERSRFVLVTDGEIWRYGAGWLQRNGFYYSNPSALADTKVWNNGTQHAGVASRVTYEGGLLDAKHGEIVSDNHFPEATFDNVRKLWTNIKPPPEEPKRKQHWDQTQRKMVDDEPPVFEVARGSIIPFRQRASNFDSAVTPTLDAINAEISRRKRGNGRHSTRDNYNYNRALEEYFIDPEASTDRADAIEDKILADWRRKIINDMDQVLWMKVNVAKFEGYQCSWPRPTDFDFSAPGEFNGQTLTRRIKGTGELAQWREVIFVNGEHVSTSVVPGPYPGGLIITSGNPVVTFADTEMTIDSWRALVFNHYWPDAFSDEPEELEEDSPNPVLEVIKVKIDPKTGKETVTVEQLEAPLDYCC